MAIPPAGITPHHTATLGDKIGGAWDAAGAGVRQLITGKDETQCAGPVGRSPSAIAGAMGHAYDAHQMSHLTKQEMQSWMESVMKFNGAQHPGDMGYGNSGMQGMGGFPSK